jgi:hypothetical protein
MEGFKLIIEGKRFFIMRVYLERGSGTNQGNAHLKNYTLERVERLVLWNPPAPLAQAPCSQVR